MSPLSLAPLVQCMGQCYTRPQRNLTAQSRDTDSPVEQKTDINISRQ